MDNVQKYNNCIKVYHWVICICSTQTLLHVLSPVVSVLFGSFDYRLSCVKNVRLSCWLFAVSVCILD
jgi:hypothetical protein